MRKVITSDNQKPFPFNFPANKPNCKPTRKPTPAQRIEHQPPRLLSHQLQRPEDKTPYFDRYTNLCNSLRITTEAPRKTIPLSNRKPTKLPSAINCSQPQTSRPLPLLHEPSERIQRTTLRPEHLQLPANQSPPNPLKGKMALPRTMVVVGKATDLEN